MKDLRQTVEEYFEDFTVRDFGDFAIISPPIFPIGGDESFALRVEKIEKGYVFGDCHSITDYWEYAGIDADKYNKKIERICDAFGLSFDGRSFSLEIKSECEGVLKKYLGYFLQAVAVLACITI